jgi:hypothetical protein
MTAATAESRTDGNQDDIVAQWLDEGRHTGRADTYAGKRRSVRYTLQAPVLVEVIGAGPGTAPQYGYSRDVSRGGMSVKCRQRIATMSRVRVTREDTNQAVCGRIRHCTTTLNGFIIGIEFEAGPQECDAVRKSA